MRVRSQWHEGSPLAAHSCGGSHGLGENLRTVFPFHPGLTRGTNVERTLETGL
jgi:hypothetical protein